MRARVSLRLGSEVGVPGGGQGQPAQLGLGVLGADRVGGGGGHEEPDVGVLVGGLPLARRHLDDDHLLDLGVRPRHQVGQAGLFLRFPGDDGERVGLPRVAMTADLKPGLLALVPAQQDPAGGRVHDQRGRGDVQRQVTPVGVAGGRQERPHWLGLGRLGFALPARRRSRSAVSSATERVWRAPGDAPGVQAKMSPACGSGGPRSAGVKLCPGCRDVQGAQVRPAEPGRGRPA